MLTDISKCGNELCDICGQGLPLSYCSHTVGKIVFTMNSSPSFNNASSRRRGEFRFFCPLCRAERTITTHYKMSPANYWQVFICAFFLLVTTWPLIGVKSLALFFIVWAVIEGVRRLLWRKEIPCPHCGLDAAWYKRDVRIAHKKVKEFWQTREET